MSNETTTELGQITGTLKDLAQVFAIVTPYASTDKPALALAKITSATIEACDSYAAIRHTTEQLFTATTSEPFTLPAAEVAKALQAAAKLAGKRAHNITATITATPETWTLTTTEGQTIGGPNPQHEQPNTAAIWTTARNTEPTTFQAFSLAQWQIERLAKTTKQTSTGNEQPATLTHYTDPTKPVIYTITTHDSTTELLIMPTKTRTN